MNAFSFDDGRESDRLPAKGDWIDGGQRVSFAGRGRDAERTHRQIIETIWTAETSDQLEDYMARESIVIDALWFDFPEFAALVDEAAEEQRAILRRVPRPAEPDSPTAQDGKTANQGDQKMSFDFDTGGGGSEGPWIAWSANGTKDRKIGPEEFYLREGEQKTAFNGFKQGVVLDIFNMKTGWQRSDGIVGQAPEWKWNASPAQMAAQPGEDFKKGFQIKCAIGSGNVATWEQAGAGAWNAFADLVPALQQGPGDGSLPMVRVTGVRQEKYKRGQTSIPVLEVVKWVPRPDCLKEGFTAETDPAPQHPTQQASKAAAATVDAEVAF